MRPVSSASALRGSILTLLFIFSSHGVVLAKTPSFDEYNLPTLLRAFYQKDIKKLASMHQLDVINYIATVHNQIGSEAIIMIAENPAKLMLIPDKRLGKKMAQLTSQDPEISDAAMQDGYEMLINPLLAMAQARKNNATIQEEVRAMQGAIVQSDLAKLEELREMAQQDTIRLVVHFNDTGSAELLKRVYKGMVTYVDHRLRTTN